MARRARIHEPYHRLHSEGAATKIEHLGFRENRNHVDKYAPHMDSWLERVWEWPIPLPYRQDPKLHGTVWTTGQVPWEPGSNSGVWMYPGDLHAQSRLALS